MGAISDVLNQHPSGDQPLHNVSQAEPLTGALVQAQPVKYDLIAGLRRIGSIARVEEDEAGERWLLNIEAFGKQQVSVKFTNEHEAHQMAEEWTRAMDRVARLADTMQRNGFGYTVR